MSLLLCVAAGVLFILNVMRIHPVANFYHDGIWWRVGAVSGHVGVETRVDPRDHQPDSLQWVNLVVICGATALLPISWYLSRQKKRTA